MPDPVWYAVQLYVMVYAWRAVRNAETAAARTCSCNEEGSRILARLVVTIDKSRKFVGRPGGWTCSASTTFRVKERRFRVTVVPVDEVPKESE